MNIKQLIDGGLQYITRRRDMTKKKTTKLVYERCRSCGGEVVVVNSKTRRRACIESKCGKEAH